MQTRRSLLATGAALPLAALAAQPLFAADPETFARDGLAINGFDPVAYFTDAAPVEGDAAHAVEWNGAEWRFSSAENKAKFEADPEAFAPQYGGYCAYAVSKGYTAKTDPDAWTIHDGKLYLNYDRSVRGIWERDIPGNIAKADGNWPTVLGN